jgi:hypothetical protein
LGLINDNIYDIWDILWSINKDNFLERIYPEIYQDNKLNNKKIIEIEENLEEPINLKIYINWCKNKNDLGKIKSTNIYKNLIKSEKNLIIFLETYKNSYKKIQLLEKNYDFLQKANIRSSTLKMLLPNNINELENKLKVILEYKDKIDLKWTALWLALQVWTSKELEKKLEIILKYKWIVLEWTALWLALQVWTSVELDKKLEVILEYKDKWIVLEWGSLWLVLQLWTSVELDKKLEVILEYKDKWIVLEWGSLW